MVSLKQRRKQRSETIYTGHVSKLGKVPREIEIANEGLIYTIPVWVEAPVAMKAVRRRSGEPSNCPLDNSTVSAYFKRDVRAKKAGNVTGHID